MTEHVQIEKVVETARAFIAEGDQGEAQALLTRALLSAPPAQTASEATAIAEATGALIGLDAGLLPLDVLLEHIERMDVLTDGFDDAATEEARAVAEVQAVEWVHEDGDEDMDPVVLVDVLRLASALVHRHAEAEHIGVRRAAAEAALTAQMIRNWLGQDPLSIAVALEALALSLTGEEDARMRLIRINALASAARFLIENDAEPQDARFLLRSVVSESVDLPDALRFRFSALLRLADLDIEDGASTEDALREGLEALHAGDDPDRRSAWLRCRFADDLLQRLPDEERDERSVAEWTRLLERFAVSSDPEVRHAALEYVRIRAGAAATMTAADLRILQVADARFQDDRHPDTMAARFLIAVRIAEVFGVPDARPVGDATSAPRDIAHAVRLAEDLPRRFPEAMEDDDLAPEVARALLERALRLSDLGRRDEALALLTDIRTGFRSVREPGRLRHLFAQADYWSARLTREGGDRARGRRLAEAMVDEFGADPDPDVRIWAGNTLFSTWRAEQVDDEEAEAAFQRFAELFGDDQDVRIRRLDASRLTTQAHRAHERGARERAVELFQAVVSTYEDDPDGEIADDVRLARENLTVLSLALPSPATATDAGGARYRALRDRLLTADELLNTGRGEEAARLWQATIDETAGDPDTETALLGLAAMDVWSAELAEAGRWAAVADLSRRATVIREGMDHRAGQIRARAYLRLALALSRLGDPRAAVATYEALDGLVAGSEDDEIVTARQQAAYNRAVLLDDLGEVDAALYAYDHVLAVHTARIDSASQRLRRVKALRNKALILDGLGRIAEAAGAHRLILDIATAAPDAELNQRARASAFDLAACFTRLGDPASAAATYAWVRTAVGLGLSDAEVRSAVRSQKVAEKEARRRGR
ncbi:tetratricopeptide (TPR) repeat protein [Microbacterium resistens]|uniref:Tetratricopeptide (TPR) repeat protein n=1 Tax=Microbacterium resistens TaxID=156977 RepID=A0ABU1SAK8_9MICO|nr:hypothetical protein [Microbacterium resistens]MDR6865882.1 tetratricopeptide (TPR) repeat protein [Microbacterium resistens]